MTVVSNSKSLGEALCFARKQIRLTQSQLALAAGVGVRFIVELESGKPTVRFEHVLRVIAALGGELVLSGLPVSKRSGTLAWGNFFELLRSIEVPPDFMAQREHNAVPFSIGVFDSFVSDATPGTDSDRPIVSVP